MQNAGQIASLGSLESQSGNESSSNTATILGRQDLYRVFLLRVGLLRPVEDLAQGLCATSFKVRVLVEDRSIGTDVAGFVILLLGDGCDTAGGKSSGAGSDELCQSSDQLKLRDSRSDIQLGLEGVKSLLKILKRVPLIFVSVNQ
jgi:hypothetical protein